MLKTLRHNINTWIAKSIPDAGHSYKETLNRELGPMSSILDLGCGSTSPVQYVQTQAHKVGYDVHGPSIEKSKAAGIHHEYIEDNLENIDKYFGPKSFDAVMAMDLIEHLPREKSLQLINQMERIARKRVVIFTPTGFLHQGEYDANPYQIHLSGWNPAEFRKRGYRTYGMYGWRSLRGELSYIRWKPKTLWTKISDLSQKLVYSRPGAAFEFFAIKDIT